MTELERTIIGVGDAAGEVRRGGGGGVERTKMQPYFAIEIYTTVLQGPPRN